MFWDIIFIGFVMSGRVSSEQTEWMERFLNTLELNDVNSKIVKEILGADWTPRTLNQLENVSV